MLRGHDFRKTMKAGNSYCEQWKKESTPSVMSQHKVKDPVCVGIHRLLQNHSTCVLFSKTSSGSKSLQLD